MQPLPNRDQLLKRVLLRAVTAPVSLFLLTAGLLLAVSSVAWPAGVALLGGELVWIWSRLRDTRYARESSDDMLRRRWRELIQRLEQISQMLDRDTAAALSAVVEAQERLLALYGEGGSLAPHSTVELTNLLEHCLSLAEKRHRAQAYLAANRSHEVQRQAIQLQRRVDQTPDPVARQLYEQALEQKRQELENFVRLEEAVVRIDGQLAAVQCTFDNMLSQVVRLQSAHGVEAGSASDPVFEELNRMVKGVTALEDSLAEVLSVRGAA
jgi:hypothetical protein